MIVVTNVLDIVKLCNRCLDGLNSMCRSLVSKGTRNENKAQCKCIPLGEHGLFRNQLLIYPAEPGRRNIPFSGGWALFRAVPSPGPLPRATPLLARPASNGRARNPPGTKGGALFIQRPQPGLPHPALVRALLLFHLRVVCVLVVLFVYVP